MFAVVRTGGKQYRIAADQKIIVDRLPGEAGDTVTLGDVLLMGEAGDLKAGAGQTVTAEIVAQTIKRRDELLAEMSRRYADRDVERPSRWGGYRISPTSYEFWQGRTGRLHDRLRYDRDLEAGPDGWRITRLAP